MDPRKTRGRRECRELAAPMARLRKKMQAAGTTGSAETSRHSPRDGFHVYSVLSPVYGCLATVAVGIITRQLSASVAAPGPHDFTSASCRSSACKHAAAPRGHRLPASRVVTIAIRPSWRSRMGAIEHSFWKSESFFHAHWPASTKKGILSFYANPDSRQPDDCKILKRKRAFRSDDASQPLRIKGRSYAHEQLRT